MSHPVPESGTPPAPPPSPPARRLLVVDDEWALVRTLRAPLERQGHMVAYSSHCQELPCRVAAQAIDLVVLEPARLPISQAMRLCTALQAAGGVWLVLVSRLACPDTQVQALGAGADLCLPKRTPPALLLAQVQALLRRPPPPRALRLPRPVSARWTLDEGGHALVGTGGRMACSQPLSPLELRLLRYLLDHPDVVVEQAALLAAVWGTGYEDADGELRQYVHYLRQKIEPDPQHPQHLLAVRGLGYLYRPPS